VRAAPPSPHTAARPARPFKLRLKRQHSNTSQRNAAREHSNTRRNGTLPGSTATHIATERCQGAQQHTSQRNAAREHSNTRRNGTLPGSTATHIATERCQGAQQHTSQRNAAAHLEVVIGKARRLGVATGLAREAERGHPVAHAQRRHQCQKTRGRRTTTLCPPPAHAQYQRREHPFSASFLLNSAFLDGRCCTSLSHTLSHSSTPIQQPLSQPLSPGNNLSWRSSPRRLRGNVPEAFSLSRPRHRTL
jgi:hypothetical protein